MNAQDLATSMRRFIDEVYQAYGGLDRPLTASDMRRGIYEARLSEISAWSGQCLDMFDAHAARFANDTPIAHLLETSIDADPASNLDELALCGTPSPFAWS